jgi:hypothetical protein
MGVVAYKLFGPSAADRPDASFTSLFSPKPKNAPGAAGQDGSASADGASKSLQMAADANSKKDAAPQDQAADSPAAAAAAASAAAAPPPNKNQSAMGGTIAKLKSDHQIGELSKGAASGSGGSMSAGGGAGGAPLLASAKTGNIGGMSASHAGAGSSLAAARARALGGSAAQQLGAVRKNQVNAQSSMAAGTTYDGNTQTPSQAAGSGSGAGSGTNGAGDTNPGVNPGGGGGGDSQFPSDVPSVTGTNVTPWQAAINTASLALMGAAMLLMMASKVAKMKSITLVMGQTIICLLAGIAAALGAWVISLGAQIGGGQYGQKLQGELLAVAGGCIMATATIAIVSVLGATSGNGSAAAAAAKTPGAPAPPAAAPKPGTPGPADDKSLAGVMAGNPNLLMMCCGGAALAATAWAYMAPKNIYPASDFQNGRPPDYDHSYQPAQSSVMPSQGILDRYLV